MQTSSRYLKYLPGIFQKQGTDQQEPFLGRYLLPFDGAFAEYEHLLATLDQYVSPDMTPAEEFLPWLASWVALSLDEEWDEDKQRELIAEAVTLYRWRGTGYGLKRFLELYTGVSAEAICLSEGRRPAGMQIGVASRIGGRADAANASSSASGQIDAKDQDYYVIDTVMPTEFPPGVEQPPVSPGQPLRLYYAADQVERLEFDDTGVCVWYRPSLAGAAIILHHAHLVQETNPEPRRPNIQWCGEQTAYRYRSTLREGDGEPKIVTIIGGSFLIEQMASPYRFIVDIHTTEDATCDTPENRKRWSKVRRILDQEKPAHTAYYLRASPIVSQVEHHWMQIEVRSSVGLDTAIG